MITILKTFFSSFSSWIVVALLGALTFMYVRHESDLATIAQKDFQIVKLQYAPPETLKVRQIVYVPQTVIRNVVHDPFEGWIWYGPGGTNHLSIDSNGYTSTEDSLIRSNEFFKQPRTYSLFDSADAYSLDGLDTVKLKWSQKVFDDRPVDSLSYRMTFDPIFINKHELLKTAQLDAPQRSFTSQIAENLGYVTVIAGVLYFIYSYIHF